MSTTTVKLDDLFRDADGVWKVISLPPPGQVELQCQNTGGEWRNAIIRYPAHIVRTWERVPSQLGAGE